MHWPCRSLNSTNTACLQGTCRQDTGLRAETLAVIGQGACKTRYCYLLSMLAACRGPLSAAIYLSLVQQPVGTLPHSRRPEVNLSPSNQQLVDDAKTAVAEAFRQLEASTGACAPVLMLFVEVFDSEAARVLYPVNMLRNYARLGVRTPLLLAVDADLVVSRGLAQELSDPARCAASRPVKHRPPRPRTVRAYGGGCTRASA